MENEEFQSISVQIEERFSQIFFEKVKQIHVDLEDHTKDFGEGNIALNLANNVLLNLLNRYVLFVSAGYPKEIQKKIMFDFYMQGEKKLSQMRTEIQSQIEGKPLC